MNWAGLARIAVALSTVVMAAADAFEQRKSDLIIDHMTEELEIAEQIQLLEPEKFTGAMNSIFVRRCGTRDRASTLQSLKSSFFGS